MKSFITLIIMTFVFGTIWSQSNLSQELGTPKEQVTSFLATKKGVTITSPNDNTLTASSSGFKVDFIFNEGVLYKTVTVRSFSNKKEVAEAVKSLKDYYMLIKASQVDLSGDSKDEKFAAVQGRVIHEVTTTTLSKESFELCQSKVDLDRCPIPEMRALVGNEKIFAMISQ